MRPDMAEALSPPPALDLARSGLEYRPRVSLALSERLLLLRSLDMFLVGAGAWYAGSALPGPGRFPLLSTVFACLWAVCAQLTGLYDLTVAARPRSLARRLSAVLAIAVIASLIVFFFDPFWAARGKLMAAILMGLLLITLWRLLYARFLGSPHFARRVVILGAGMSALQLMNAIRNSHGHGIEVIGLLDDDVRKHGIDFVGSPVLGPVSDLFRVIRTAGVEQVVVAVTRNHDPSLMQTLGLCYEHGINVTLMPHLYEEVTGQVPVEHIGPLWMVGVPLTGSGRAIYESCKRLLDIAVSVLGLILTAPLLAALALLVRFTSAGPVLYRQRRVGRHGQMFDIIKFRTMTSDAEHSGAQWAVPNDPRTTAVGRWLRRTHLDELPQLFLVLRGHMSLVGPRPERPEFVADLERSVPLFRARLAVTPGVTGWAQVRYPYGSSVNDALAKLRYDLFYVRHRSLLFDITIVIETARRVFGARGR